MIQTIRNSILSIIDWFHTPFRRWIDVQTFRYLACGGGNQVLDILIYAIAYNFILLKQPLIFNSSLIIPAHLAAFAISFSVSFPIGFFLMRYVVFTESNLRGRVQLFRYAVMVAMCILLNALLLQAFVKGCGFYPTPSKVLTTAIVAVFSYVAQRNFTFKVKEEPAPLSGQ